MQRAPRTKGPKDLDMEQTPRTPAPRAPQPSGTPQTVTPANPQRRFADRNPGMAQPHRRSTDPQRRATDPNLTRKGLLSHPGTLMMGLGGVLFAAYIFNFNGTATYLDALFNGWNDAAHAQNHAVQSGVVAAIPYAVGFIALIILYAILKGISSALTSHKTTKQLAPRKEISLQEFTEHVGQRGISPKVAKEAFKLLLPYYRNRMRTRLSDSLTTVLQLNRVQIADLYANMLYQTDRHMPMGDVDIDVDTVLELLTLVEKATPRSSNEQPFIPPAPRRKGLSRLTGIFIPPARLQAARAATPKAAKPSGSKIKLKP
jgi:hypothetical protein